MHNKLYHKQNCQKNLIYLFFYHIAVPYRTVKLLQLSPSCLQVISQEMEQVCASIFTFFVVAASLLICKKKKKHFLSFVAWLNKPTLRCQWSMLLKQNKNLRNAACNSRNGQEGYLTSFGKRCIICFQSDLMYCFHRESKNLSIHDGLLLCIVKNKYTLPVFEKE